MELVDLDNIKVMETGEFTLWAKKDEDVWSRNIMDMILYLKKCRKLAKSEGGKNE